ncbi:MAG: toll/interleukin-1 receptor domain-containing protein, partial [Pseudomonadota bacterium]|nr:toll/interleukin-1 receptor domain-containing protein [Pseudomonadota bacterium]
AFRDQVVNALSRYAITSWRHDRDIQSGSEYRRAIEQGIEQADNFFFLISPHSVVAEQCQRELNHAAQYHKRIVPLLIAAIDETLLPEPLRGLQSIDNQSLDEILALLKRNKTYYEQHKILLVQALKWSSGGRKLSFLLIGYNLEHAKTWLRLHQQRTLHGPTALHHEFIQASEAARGQLHTEVFISYSRKDGDFARQLNLALQEAGKTTWFDQESISSGADFEQEIFKGISSSDNFVFILSPDAVTSEYCEREVNFAAQQNKRFIPLLWREGAVEAMPEALRQVHWVDFKDEVFDKSFTLLIQAIEIDRQHAYQHTLLQQRAEDWQQHQHHHDFLLNKTACVNALNWLTAAKHKQPPPTPLQQEFIAASQQAIEAGEAVERARQQRELMIERQNTQRQRVLVSALSLAFIMAVLVGGSAFWFYIQATLQIDKIFVRDLSAQARLQVDVAPQLGVLLALETVLRADELGGHERAAAEETLRQTLEQISGLAIEGYQPVLAFSPDERWLAIADYDVRL